VRDGIRPFGATGGATGGGVLAFQTDDQAAPFFRPRSGLGTGRHSDLPGHLRLRGTVGFGIGYRRGMRDAAVASLTQARAKMFVCA